MFWQTEEFIMLPFFVAKISLFYLTYMKKFIIILFSLIVLSSCNNQQKLDNDIFMKNKECLDINIDKYIYKQIPIDIDAGLYWKINKVNLYGLNWVFYSKKLNSCLLWYSLDYEICKDEWSEKWEETSCTKEHNDNLYIILDLFSWEEIYHDYWNSSYPFDKKINDLKNNTNETDNTKYDNSLPWEETSKY